MLGTAVSQTQASNGDVAVCTCGVSACIFAIGFRERGFRIS